MIARSTFTGVGGIDLGLERAGWSIDQQAESDEWCRGVLAHRFRGVPCLADVRDMAQGAEGARPAGSATAADGKHGQVDLLCGGFPCQDVSVAGKRAGLAGERSGLFFEFARIADALRPRWLLIENVPGLLTSNDGRDFGVVLATLADLGYGVAWRVLDSRYFGVPQRRRRVFLVGHSGGDARRALCALCESCGGSPAASACTWQEPSARTRSGPRDGIHYYVEDHEDGTLRANGANGGPPRTDKHPLLVSPTLTGDHPRDTGNDEAMIVETLRSHPRPGSNSSGAIVVHLTQDPISGETSPALNKDSAEGCAMPGVQQGRGVRRLTPRECERLQGFPDDWTLVPTQKCPDSRRYAAMGNAVTVNVAELIGRRILAVDAAG